MSICRFSLLPLAALLAISPLHAKEYPIGEPQQCGGIEIAAVYLQPIEMDPPGMMRPAAESDVHLEADVRALENNPNGFQEGSFVPYLQVAYELRKQGSEQVLAGGFHAMVANDGPHYGDNLKLLGPGSYELRLRVQAPSQGDSHAQHFGRHVDKETGVAPWFASCDLNYRFTYVGIGKKGGY